MTGHVFLEPPPTTPGTLPRYGWRDLRRRLPATGLGAALGALAGFFLVELGLVEMLGRIGSAQLVVAIGACIGALAGGLRQLRLVAAADALLAIAFLVVADTPVMEKIASGWVRSDPVTRVDAIVVLSAGVNSAGMLNDQGVQRLLTGLQLYQDSVAPRLFTTAVEATFGSLLRSSTADQERLVTLGGARAAWTSLTGVYTTHDEALQAASQLPAGAHTVAVVTSPMHTRRACATFEGVGFHVVCVPSREDEHAAWHPINAPDRLASFGQYVYERLGMVKYRAKGWLPKST